jgi:PadR family transcriptional regulator, regulatory protein PadR
MGPSTNNLLQGTLDLLILKSLSLGQMHGLGIARHVEQITKGEFRVKAGSLFPALHRMEEAGWLLATWGESENKPRAKYYRLTPAAAVSSRANWPSGDASRSRLPRQYVRHERSLNKQNRRDPNRRH